MLAKIYVFYTPNLDSINRPIYDLLISSKLGRKNDNLPDETNGKQIWEVALTSKSC